MSKQLLSLPDNRVRLGHTPINSGPPTLEASLMGHRDPGVHVCWVTATCPGGQFHGAGNCGFNLTAIGMTLWRTLKQPQPPASAG